MKMAILFQAFEALHRNSKVKEKEESKVIAPMKCNQEANFISIIRMVKTKIKIRTGKKHKETAI